MLRKEQANTLLCKLDGRWAARLYFQTFTNKNLLGAGTGCTRSLIGGCFVVKSRSYDSCIDKVYPLR
jgi:hypothetical protein